MQFTILSLSHGRFGGKAKFLIYIHPVRETIHFIKRLTNLQKSTVTVLSFSFIGLYLSGWKPLEIQGNGGGHNYPDLSSVLNAASCFREIGSGVYAGTGDCSYQYGLLLLRIINIFHIFRDCRYLSYYNIHTFSSRFII